MSDIYYGRSVHPWAPEIEDWAEESQLEKERLKSYQQTILQVGSLLHQPPFSSSQTSGFFEKKSLICLEGKLSARSAFVPIFE